MRLPLLLAGCLLPLWAAAQGSALTTQQQRMKDCNARAATQAPKGEARRVFMKGCLSGGKVEVEFGAAGEALPLPQAEMPVQAESVEPLLPAEPSEADARRAIFKRRLGPCIGKSRAQELKGEARKTFMSQCLKTEPISDHQATP